ncbi:MFS transporter [Bradyrhizobium ontarionense]|uniref:MFS transporter n=2 Tax=Bradyrhizobium ontarionense TaxID=2898149 RepID=A0ABY3RDP8_9BRAD|nr:MFS transporter [Bradyrhizobium sp. A19]
MVADSLESTVFEIGQTATAFSVAFALGGPLLASPTSRFDRRTLLTAGLLLFSLAAVLGALAPDYGVLMLSRIVAGVAGSLVTPHAATTASLLAEESGRGRAIALVLLGFAASTVFGVPLGTMVGAVFGWRAAFGVISLLALAGAVGVRLAVPGQLNIPPIDLGGWRKVFAHRAIIFMLAVTLFQVLGQATILTYLAILLRVESHASVAEISALLMVFGGAGIAGTFAASRLMDRVGAALVANASIILMCAVMTVWPFIGGSVPGVTLLILLWGLSSFAVNSAQQYRLIATAPSLATASVSLNSSSSFFGQSLGALVGGAVVAFFGVATIPSIGALAMMIALGLSLASNGSESRKA